MNNLQPYDLLLVKGESWISNTIKKITDSPYSHVAIVAHDTDSLYETKLNKPFNIYANSYNEDQCDVYRYKNGFSLKQIQSMQRFLIRSQNMRYDLLKTVSNGLFILFKLPIVDSIERMNCVESAKLLYQYGNVELKGFTPEQISQNDCLIKIN